MEIMEPSLREYYAIAETGIPYKGYMVFPYIAYVCGDDVTHYRLSGRRLSHMTQYPCLLCQVRLIEGRVCIHFVYFYDTIRQVPNGHTRVKETTYPLRSKRAETEIRAMAGGSKGDPLKRHSLLKRMV